VYLYPPAPVGNSLTSLNISWSKNEDTDFVAYRIYRSLTAGVDSTSTLISIIDDQNSTTYEDTGLQGNTTYYYRVYVYDSSGLTRGSNEVNGTTNMNQPPAAITLFSVSPVANSLTRLNLNWSKNEDNDFAAYRIYRSLNPNVDSTSVLVTTITDQNITSYEDEGLEQDTEYYYRIFVYDSRGLYSKSNEKKGRTNSNTRPTAVVLYPVVALQDDLNSLRLNWSENGNSDFSKYKIYRSNSVTVDSTSFLVQTITDQHATEYEDTGLDEATTYYYRIYVYDGGGLAAGSNIESGTTHANEAPTPVVLASPSIIDSVSLGLSWSRNSDDDFAMYTLFRSKTSISDTVSIAPTAIINDQEITEFTDSNLEQNTTYYYRIFVNDSGGLRSGSNEVHAKTMP
ncbi:hypothetical protein GF337_00335, partial [candidate division KSB1 bacterium]|nr:hypothetical protein [candidate division KSB1 bacterium]